MCELRPAQVLTKIRDAIPPPTTRLNSTSAIFCTNRSVVPISPLLVSQTLTVLSSEPDASRLPSGENTAELTDPSWPSSVCRHEFQSSSTVGLLALPPENMPFLGYELD